MSYALAALLMTLLGVAYVKGYDWVKNHSPEHLVHFYLIMATIRMLFVLTTIGLYVFFAQDRGDVIHFVATVLIMYGMMMILTLSLRH